jgi:hypothetical protein
MLGLTMLPMSRGFAPRSRQWRSSSGIRCVSLGWLRYVHRSPRGVVPVWLLLVRVFDGQRKTSADRRTAFKPELSRAHAHRGRGPSRVYSSAPRTRGSRSRVSPWPPVRPPGAPPGKNLARWVAARRGVRGPPPPRPRARAPHASVLACVCALRRPLPCVPVPPAPCMLAQRRRRRPLPCAAVAAASPAYPSRNTRALRPGALLDSLAYGVATAPRRRSRVIGKKREWRPGSNRGPRDYES